MMLVNVVQERAASRDGAGEGRHGALARRGWEAGGRLAKGGSSLEAGRVAERGRVRLPRRRRRERRIGHRGSGQKAGAARRSLSPAQLMLRLARLPRCRLPLRLPSLSPALVSLPRLSSCYSTRATPPKELRENIYTIPNALTCTRILACPAIGYFVLQGQLGTATVLLFAAGVTDLVGPPHASVSELTAQLDGWLARKYNMGTVLGSILDPAADKLLMTTMVVTLTMQSMLPRTTHPLVTTWLTRPSAARGAHPGP